MDTRTHFERKLDKFESDLADLERHVQHIAATMVALVEQLKADGTIEVDDA